MPHMSVCQRCGSEFVRPIPQKYCSRACANRQTTTTSRQGRSCEVCGTIFTANWSKQRTCGRACGVRIRKDPRHGKGKTVAPIEMRKVYFPTCKNCGQIFCSRRQRQFCARPCEDKWWNTQRQGPRFKPCVDCGTSVSCRRSKCDDCVAKTRQARKARNRARRRVLLQRLIVESFALAEIAVRDGKRCGICHGRVLMGRAVPHPKAPTMDHILPLAAGGEHSRSNMQLAHFICNSLKSDRVNDIQLPLFG